jgi:hypothetical protein
VYEPETTHAELKAHGIVKTATKIESRSRSEKVKREGANPCQEKRFHGADVLRSPDQAVSELEISWASEEREEPDGKEKEPEGEVEGKEKLEQEPYNLLPEPRELEEDAESPLP